MATSGRPHPRIREAFDDAPRIHVVVSGPPLGQPHLHGLRARLVPDRAPPDLRRRDRPGRRESAGAAGRGSGEPRYARGRGRRAAAARRRAGHLLASGRTAHRAGRHGEGRGPGCRHRLGQIRRADRGRASCGARPRDGIHVPDVAAACQPAGRSAGDIGPRRHGIAIPRGAGLGRGGVRAVHAHAAVRHGPPGPGGPLPVAGPAQPARHRHPGLGTGGRPDRGGRCSIIGNGPNWPP